MEKRWWAMSKDLWRRERDCRLRSVREKRVGEERTAERRRRRRWKTTEMELVRWERWEEGRVEREVMIKACGEPLQ